MTPNLYYVHADHLNRPIMMTDASKTAVWNASYRPFGEVHSITGSASNNLRFPGQYFLIESGLAYNWHRHYDPTLGRYTQPDPLGFVDGPSVYAYASLSPLMLVDPTGLAPKDKWYGFTNRDFQAWCHSQKKPGDSDFMRREIEELWKQWNREGRPGPDAKGPYSPRGRGGGSRGGGSRGGGGMGGGGKWGWPGGFGGPGPRSLPPWN